MFQKNVLSSHSVLKSKSSKQSDSSALFTHPSTPKGCTFLQIICKLLPNYMVSHPRIQYSSRSLLWEAEFQNKIKDSNIVTRCTIYWKSWLSIIVCKFKFQCNFFLSLNWNGSAVFGNRHSSVMAKCTSSKTIFFLTLTKIWTI